MRVAALTALSRFTFEPWANLPRFVRRRVSGAQPTLKNHEDSGPVLENSVMVRQVPFTEMLSPRAASGRMVGQEEMVRDVPEPPVAEESRGLSSVTARGDVRVVVLGELYVRCLHDEDHGGWVGADVGVLDSLPIVSTRPVNIVPLLQWSLIGSG